MLTKYLYDIQYIALNLFALFDSYNYNIDKGLKL